MIRANKYGAVKQEYRGVKYDSKREAAHAAKLDLLIRAKEVDSWERQVAIPLKVEGVLIATYRIDFKVKFRDGRVEYHEVKGFSTQLWKLKFKLAKALYPDLVFVVIK